MNNQSTLFVQIRGGMIGAFVLSAVVARAEPRRMEELDRGVVAVKVDQGVYVGWRLLRTDPREIRFNVYRDGRLVNAQPVDGATNLVDAGGTTRSTYAIHPVLRQEEMPEDGRAAVWPTRTLKIPLDRPSGGKIDGKSYVYTPNDIGVGDLDGDGQWELVVKWDPSNSSDNTGKAASGNVYLDAYELSGERLWRIDLGRNIKAGPHYTQFLVGDYDGDGRGVFLAKGPAVDDDDAADYRDTLGRVLAGPEYLTIFDGRTGAEMHTVGYLPSRGKVDAWGDDYGNRVDRFLATNAYLDGVNPSISRKSTRPGANGVVEISPFEFLDRLADLVPPQRKHRHRYHGVFAPNHKLRRAVTALAKRECRQARRCRGWRVCGRWTYGGRACHGRLL